MVTLSFYAFPRNNVAYDIHCTLNEIPEALAATDESTIDMLYVIMK